MRGKETIPLMKAPVTSQISYRPPYHELKHTEENQINTIISTAHEAALNLPIFRDTEKVV